MIPFILLFNLSDFFTMPRDIYATDRDIRRIKFPCSFVNGIHGYEIVKRDDLTIICTPQMYEIKGLEKQSWVL